MLHVRGSRYALVQRSTFVAVLMGAAGSTLIPRAAGAGQAVDLDAPLRIRLFSASSLTRVTINGVAVDARAATISGSDGTKPLGAKVFEFTGDPYLNVVAVGSDGAEVERRYPGAIFVQPQPTELLVINQLDMETYVASVLSAEVSPGWAPESLRAQAIAVRTYAAHSRMSSAGRSFDLSDDTSSQVYRGIAAIAPSLWCAARDTARQLVLFRGSPASVFYSSSCGGHTAASEELTSRPSPPYLNGIPDLDDRGRAYCGGAPYFRWANSVTTDAMARVVGLPADQLTGITVSERWADGRVRTIAASGSVVGVSLSGHDFYQRALAVLGYKVIPSAMFDISRKGSDFQLVGHGVGHGVGMCQWGARGRAESGMSAAQILQAYFPGTTIARI